jgi:hypothetical protein
LKIRVSLSIACSSIQTGKELARVLAPDNAGAPRDLEIVMNERHGTVYFDIASRSSSTGLSTVMAILGDVALFEQVWLLSRAGGA